MILFSFLLAMVACTAMPIQPMGADAIEGFTLSDTLRVVPVQNANQLKAALAAARPGDSIVVAPGVYSGKFVLAQNGTASAPIIVAGAGATTVLDAGDTNTGYVFHLKGNYCKIKDMKLQHGLKGLITDGASFNILEYLTITQVGEEGVHLRAFSSNNTVQHCEITDTGLKRPGYGEGVYIGTAYSNWNQYTGGQPDTSNYNQILYNKIGPGVTAESIDIKEGTTGGLIAFNTMYAAGISGENSADSWLDVKGNHYLIEKNQGIHDGTNANFLDGIQVNCAYAGWGSYNVFSENDLEVNSAGYAIHIRLKSSKGQAIGNIVKQSNTQQGAAKGMTNITLTTN